MATVTLCDICGKRVPPHTRHKHKGKRYWLQGMTPESGKGRAGGVRVRNMKADLCYVCMRRLLEALILGDDCD